jgi:hypothetical protein
MAPEEHVLKIGDAVDKCEEPEFEFDDEID